LDDYAPLSDTKKSIDDLIRFMQKALPYEGESIEIRGQKQFALVKDGFEQMLFTTDREEATNSEKLHLVGLDHPLIAELLDKYRNLDPEYLSFYSSELNSGETVSVWEVRAANEKGHNIHSIMKLAVDEDGNRIPHLEKQIDTVFKAKGKNSVHGVDSHKIEAVLERELHHRNIVKPEQSYSAKLISLACG
ncbi:TPA: helicase, partial [Enterobacter kobei]|nr:helicase [Enterobacter kobei]